MDFVLRTSQMFCNFNDSQKKIDIYSESPLKGAYEYILNFVFEIIIWRENKKTK